MGASPTIPRKNPPGGLLFILGAAVGLAGCGGEPVPASPPGPAAPVVVAETPAFDGARALEEVRRFVELGARDAGTPGAERGALWIRDRLETLGIPARLDRFPDDTPRGTSEFRNVLAELPGATADWIVLGAHYDTKAGIFPFEGANDSGSGVGVLIELARILRATPPARRPSVRLAFFDGEECRVSYGPRDGLHGSRRLAVQLRAEVQRAPVRAVIIVDMVGDRDLNLTIPRNGTPALMRALFAAAEAEGLRHRIRLGAGSILDDHVPFLERGFPAVDLIDFEYGSAPGLNDYWHTPADTLDKLSAESLAVTGRIIRRYLALQTPPPE